MELGVAVRILAAETLTPQDLEAALRSFKPDVLHVHHAYKAGRLLWENNGLKETVPLVVSPAGTDLDLDIRSRQRNRVIRHIVDRAKFLIVQSQEMGARLAERLGQVSSKVVMVPKACAWFGDEPYDLRAKVKAGPKDVLFFLPAGIRPVKGNLQWLKKMEKLQALRPNLKAVLAGPILVPSYGRKVLKEVERLHTFACWIGSIPPAAMKDAYRGADVVVNSSFSEGLSNAIMEAVIQGRPILASDVPGNRWPLMGSGDMEPCAILYDPHDPWDMVKKALLLMDNKDLRQRLSAACVARARQWPSPLEEAKQLANIYQECLSI